MIGPLSNMTFTHPGLLWLLLIVPLLVIASWRYGVKTGRMPTPAPFLRGLAALAIILAIVDPLIATSASSASAIFVVDQSGSIPPGTSDEVAAWVNAALNGAPAGAESAVITFGANPNVAAPMGSASSAASSWRMNAAVDGSATNLESALAVANALPTHGSRRIVVLSDGAENAGSAISQASQMGAPIDTVAVPGISNGDLRIEQVSIPSAIWSGDHAGVTVSINSPALTDVKLQINVDGQLLSETNLNLSAGINSAAIDLGVLEPGFHAIDAIIVPNDSSFDPVPANDALPAAIMVRNAPNLLFVASENGDTGLLSAAFTRRGAIVTKITPQNLPTAVSSLAPYDAIVLNNVAASDLTIDQIAAIDQAARTLGKGVLVTGGASSYGPGGYAGTDLEKMLPVTVKVTDGAQRPRVALLLIIDHSGSMTYSPKNGVSKLDMARDAAKQAVSVLADGDQIGVLVFNDKQQWQVPMTVIEGQATRDRINASIDELTADSGTEVYPAMQVGLDAIRAVDVDVRHVILLSDGKSSSGTRESYQALIDAAARDRVTVSTLALGEDADKDLLQFIAQQGGGNYYLTETPDDIPRYTLQEAMSAGRQSVVRGGFTPIQVSASPIMDGIELAAMPDLDGYDFTEIKPEGNAVLTSRRMDPILANWQYGLGRVVAWTADDGSDFALQWRTWDQYDAFFASVLRWTLPDPEFRAVNTTVSRDGDAARFRFTATGAGGQTADLERAVVTVVGPGGGPGVPLPLVAVGADIYEGVLPQAAEGAYQVTIAWPGSVTDQSAVVLPPSPELRPTFDGTALMASLSAQSGGDQLTLDDRPANIYAPIEDQDSGFASYRHTWGWLLSLGLFAALMEWSIRLGFWRRLEALFGSRSLA
jgi:Mg-chelatase subunit ChlD